MNNKNYDLSYLLELNDAGCLIELLDLFLTATPEILSLMQTNLDGGNLVEMYRNAHTVRSSLGMLQMTSMSAIAADIELLAKNGSSLECLQEKLSELVERFSEIRVSIEEELLEARGAYVTK